jgi:hypothetical protein
MILDSIQKVVDTRRKILCQAEDEHLFSKLKDTLRSKHYSLTRMDLNLSDKSNLSLWRGLFRPRIIDTGCLVFAKLPETEEEMSFAAENWEKLSKKDVVLLYHPQEQLVKEAVKPFGFGKTSVFKLTRIKNHKAFVRDLFVRNGKQAKEEVVISLLKMFNRDYARIEMEVETIAAGIPDSIITQVHLSEIYGNDMTDEEKVLTSLLRMNNVKLSRCVDMIATLPISKRTWVASSVFSFLEMMFLLQTLPTSNYQESIKEWQNRKFAPSDFVVQMMKSKQGQYSITHLNDLMLKVSKYL